jgi:hypothetical protein
MELVYPSQNHVRIKSRLPDLRFHLIIKKFAWFRPDRNWSIQS